MFKLSGLTPTQENLLIADREDIALNCVCFVLWTILLVRTYYGSKLTSIYVLVGLLLIAFTTDIICCVLYNWAYLGETQKDVTSDQAIILKKVCLVTFEISNLFYLEAHWIFCWRYWKVSELLAQVTKTPSRCSMRFVEAANVVVSSMIFVVLLLCMVYWGIVGD